MRRQRKGVRSGDEPRLEHREEDGRGDATEEPAENEYREVGQLDESAGERIGYAER